MRGEDFGKRRGLNEDARDCVRVFCVCVGVVETRHGVIF